MSMHAPVLTSYPRNSPEAIARVIAMMMVTDTTVDAREIEALHRLDAFGRIGLPRLSFMRVARDYCADLGRLIGERAAMRLVDEALIDAVISPIDDPELRALTCRLLVGMLTADGEVASAELAVLEQVLTRWQISREALADAIEEEVNLRRVDRATRRALPLKVRSAERPAWTVNSA